MVGEAFLNYGQNIVAQGLVDGSQLTYVLCAISDNEHQNVVQKAIHGKELEAKE